MKVFFCLVFVFGLAYNYELRSQSRDIYTNPSFDSLAKDHQTLAILPFKVTSKLRPKEKTKLNPGDLETMQREQGFIAQRSLYSYFMEEKTKKEFKVQFQDIGTTNVFLMNKKWKADSLQNIPAKLLADSLGVDGVISGDIFTDKPMSEGASIAVGVLSDWIAFGPTNSGTCTIRIHNGDDNAVLWRYEKTLSRNFGSTIQSIVNTMMRKAAKKFPYE